MKIYNILLYSLAEIVNVIKNIENYENQDQYNIANRSLGLQQVPTLSTPLFRG